MSAPQIKRFAGGDKKFKCAVGQEWVSAGPTVRFWNPETKGVCCTAHLPKEYHEFFPQDFPPSSSAGPTGKGAEGNSSIPGGDGGKTATDAKPPGVTNPPTSPASGPAGESKASVPQGTHTGGGEGAATAAQPSPNKGHESGGTPEAKAPPPQARVTIPVLNVEVGPEIIAMLLRGIGGKRDYCYIVMAHPDFGRVRAELGVYAQDSEGAEDLANRALVTVDATYRQAIKLHKEASNGGGA